MRDGAFDLEIPENNREIALHLRSIKDKINTMNDRLDIMERSIEARRYRLQDVMLGSLLLPVLAGIVLYLLTKALG